MTAKHDPEDIHLLTGGYALDALDDLERTRFERHLLACESCLAEVTEFADVAAELGSGQVAPAPDPLRASVFAAVAKTPQLVPDAEPTSVPSDLVPRQSRVGRYARFAVAAVAMVVVGVGLGSVLTAAQDQPELVAESAELLALATAPDAQVVRSNTDAGRYAFLVSEQSNRAVMLGEGVSAPAGDQTYQMWLLDAQGNAVSMGVFEPNDGGEVVLAMEGDLTGAQGFVVTLEPRGGSAVATSEPIDTVELA